MGLKTIKADFGRFIFLDDYTVVAEANNGVNIDGEKVRYAINLIEEVLPADYMMILDRKEDYSIVPVEVYTFFASLERLKAIAIVTYKDRDFLPDGMEKKIFKNRLEKFSSIREAHDWVRTIFVDGAAR